MNLPLVYRREGIRIGDIGILYHRTGFSFLFNIFLPAKHPINVGRVPDDFEHLDFSRVQHTVMKAVVCGPNGCLTSSSVRRWKNEESGYV